MQKHRKQEVSVDADVVDYIHGWDDVLSGLEGIFTKMEHVLRIWLGGWNPLEETEHICVGAGFKPAPTIFSTNITFIP